MAGTRRQDIKLASLLKTAAKDNLVNDLDDDLVVKIGRNVVKYAKIDDDSREEWLKKSKTAMELALQVVEKKTTPWEDASNVKFPLITTASLQFHARAYPAMVPGRDVVKGQVTGKDDGSKLERSIRIAQHMNWQLLEEDETWEENTDKMLLALAVEGCEFKKTYFNSDLGHNVSEWIRPKDLIVNNSTKSLSTCPRITHPVNYYPHEIDEKMMAGIWIDDDLGISEDERDEEKLQLFYEQHTFLDLNEDGYKEPYIVTVHKESETVVRIRAGYYIEDIEVVFQGKRGTLGSFAYALGAHNVDEQVANKMIGEAVVARVPRMSMFTKFGLIPSPDGSFYDIGFGQLIGPLSDSVDTVLNQLLDAGTLANTQGGFALDGVQVGSGRGDIKVKRGEFQRIKVPTGRSISEALYQLRFPEPSIVLFNLLGTLIQAAKDVTSVQDIMSGASAQGKGEAATTSMIRIEQGMKVFNAIYKRCYRSLKAEFKILYRLNSIFLEPEQYFRVLDSQQAEKIALTDYQGDGTDVQPVADPQLATNLMAMAKNQAMMSVMGHQLVDDEEILRRFFQGLDIPAPEKCIIPPERRQAPPDPEITLKTNIAASEHAKRVAEIINLGADTIKKIAQAEAEEQGTQMDLYMKQFQLIQGMLNGQGKSLSLEAAPGNAGDTGFSAEGAGAMLPGDTGGGEPQELPGNSLAMRLSEGAV